MSLNIFNSQLNSFAISLRHRLWSSDSSSKRSVMWQKSPLL